MAWALLHCVGFHSDPQRPPLHCRLRGLLLGQVGQADLVLVSGESPPEPGQGPDGVVGTGDRLGHILKGGSARLAAAGLQHWGCKSGLARQGAAHAACPAPQWNPPALESEEGDGRVTSHREYPLSPGTASGKGSLTLGRSLGTGQGVMLPVSLCWGVPRVGLVRPSAKKGPGNPVPLYRWGVCQLGQC